MGRHQEVKDQRCGVDGLLGGVIADGFHENPSASEQAAPDDSEASGLPSGSENAGPPVRPTEPQPDGDLKTASALTTTC